MTADPADTETIRPFTIPEAPKPRRRNWRRRNVELVPGNAVVDTVSPPGIESGVAWPSVVRGPVPAAKVEPPFGHEGDGVRRMTLGDGDADPAAPADESGTHIARVYNALLDGKDNYEADRELAEQFSEVAPGFQALARDNRQFLLRTTRYLANDVGLSQFIDFGACLPVGDNTHEVVQRANPDASVIYVGMDPLVLAHSRALLADNDRTHIVEIDWRTPQDVLDNPTIRSCIDFTQPVGICHVGTMMHVADEFDPWAIMRLLIEASAPGSYFPFAHLLDPGPDHPLAGLAARVQEVYLSSAMASGWFRTIDRITDMLTGLDVVEPGIVPLAEWWPDGPRTSPLAPIQHLLVGALARKPTPHDPPERP